MAAEVIRTCLSAGTNCKCCTFFFFLISLESQDKARGNLQGQNAKEAQLGDAGFGACFSSSLLTEEKAPKEVSGFFCSFMNVQG